ncbi:nicotinamidase-related amidase [Catenulispora sp. MAP5-51]|uniref:cysteine hydrolase family protein n=1 Tax=Catenulispora sp. MAP5-51 TaxID=3156298 RepID=UPI003517CD90
MQALLLIDLQESFCREEGSTAPELAREVQARGTLDNARQCLDAARGRGDLVVFVHLAFDAEHRNRTNRTYRFDEHERAQRYMAGSAESTIVSEVAPAADELVLDKGSVGPFASTILDAVLHAADVEQLAICGVATHLAVESAARDASDLGYQVSVIRDACAAPAELHDHSLNKVLPAFAEIITSSDFTATS